MPGMCRDLDFMPIYDHINSNLIFFKSNYFYGPLYLIDKCMQKCKFISHMGRGYTE